jgi:predicted dehydrogenase
VLLDLGSHHVDLIPHLLGSEARSVVSTIRSVSSQEDTATVDLIFENGVISQSMFSLAAVEEDRVEVYGTGGKLSVDRYGALAVEHSPAMRSRGAVQGVLRSLHPMSRLPAKVRKFLARGCEPSYARAFSNFAAAVRGNSAASPDLADGYRSLAIINAAEQSAASGASVGMRAEPRVVAPAARAGAS